MFNDNHDTIPSPPPTIPDNQIQEQPEENQAKSTAVTITQSTFNIPLIMVLITIVAVLFSMFYRCY
jgi:subtilase family serine protease